MADLSQPLPFTAALPAGLGSTAGGAAARPEARRPSHPVGEPPGHLQDLTRAPTTSAVTQYSEDYTFADGHSTVLTFWHRPLQAMTTAFTDAGFRLAVLSEPPYASDTPRELISDLGERSSFLCFVFFVLEVS